MLNEYKDKIELQKEVLAALPRNNNKNNKLYKAKVEEMLKEYQVDKEVVEEEITKRRNRYLSLEYDKNIPIINRINPNNLITDGFYSLYYYDTLDRYWSDVVSLLIFSVICLIISFVSLRREKYDSI